MQTCWLAHCAPPHTSSKKKRISGVNIFPSTSNDGGQKYLDNDGGQKYLETSTAGHRESLLPSLGVEVGLPLLRGENHPHLEGKNCGFLNLLNLVT